MRELLYDKGNSVYDSEIVPYLTLEDLDMSEINNYAQIMETNIDQLLSARGIYYETGRNTGVTQAGHLLFGTITPIWAYVRYLHYDGLNYRNWKSLKPH